MISFFLYSWGTHRYIRTFVHALIALRYFIYFMTLGLQSPPKLVQPSRAVDTFDQNVSNKIHKHLVTRLHLSKDKTGTQARLPTNDSTKLIRPLPTNDIIVAAMNAKTDSSSKDTTKPAIPQEAHDDGMIVSGTREKRRILDAYENKFGTGYADSIVTRKKVLYV